MNNLERFKDEINKMGAEELAEYLNEMRVCKLCEYFEEDKFRCNKSKYTKSSSCKEGIKKFLLEQKISTR